MEVNSLEKYFTPTGINERCLGSALLDIVAHLDNYIKHIDEKIQRLTLVRCNPMCTTSEQYNEILKLIDRKTLLLQIKVMFDNVYKYLTDEQKFIYDFHYVNKNNYWGNENSDNYCYYSQALSMIILKRVEAVYKLTHEDLLSNFDIYGAYLNRLEIRKGYGKKIVNIDKDVKDRKEKLRMEGIKKKCEERKKREMEMLNDE